MSNASSNRKGWSLPAPKAPLQKAMEFMRRSDVWSRIGLCVLTTGILYVVMFGWEPPFQYRIRQAPLRDLHAHTEFEYKDYKATDEKRDRTRRNFLCFYANDPQPLEQLRQALIDDLFEVTQKDFAAIQEQGSNVWSKFFPPTANNQPETSADEESFNLFREAIAADEELAILRGAVDKAFMEIDKNGLLEDLTHKFGQGNMEEIEIFPKGNFDDRRRVSVSEVRTAEVSAHLKRRLLEEFSKEETITDSKLVSQRVYDWLRPQLPQTLSWDEAKSREGVDLAESQVEMVYKLIEPGDQLEQLNSRLDRRGIRGQIPLDHLDIELLRAEHAAQVKAQTWGTVAVRSLTFFGLFAAIFAMICQYLYYRDRHLLDDLKHFSILLGLFLITLTLAWLVSMNVEWRSEIVPITIFSMTIAIAYNMELALLLGTLASLAFTVAHGFGLGEFVILTAASSAAASMCRTIRSRTKLVNVGLIVAAIVFPTVIGVQFLLGQPMCWELVQDALWFGGGAGIAGLGMTVLLPFFERWFDIQTDISLLELSDANHPLLKQLVQRAPGTYNHSINVASLSEAAAEAIGANGLLCRVGAYFHDVGKIRKPEYFIENQGGGVNKHDDLVPTMSTLVIIAHVKDGADIARKHRLPQRIIDLIEQHHGTTLVEYFYRRAVKQQDEQEDSENLPPIDEADFRYPGQRPQTREAAVMMLSDAVESACRALREPAPARIENLVNESQKRSSTMVNSMNVTSQFRISTRFRLP